jgi:hypothetical protein
MTLFPDAFMAAAVGSAIAVPTPPPMTTTVPQSFTSEGFPSGPTTSRIDCPASSVFIM